MPYATATDLLGRFGAEELAQRADRGTPRLVTAAMLATAAAGGDMSGYTADEQAAAAAALAAINQALQDADDTVNGYLAGRYELPLASPAEMVKRVVCDIARYFLYDDAATEQIEKRYDDAVKFLGAVAAGRISIGPSAAGGEQPIAGQAEMSGSAPVWGREASKGFI